MQKILVGGAAVFVLVAGGIYLMSADGKDEARMAVEKAAMEEQVNVENEALETAETMKTDEAMMGETAMNNEKMMDDEGDMMKKDEAKGTEDTMMKKAGLYAPYDASKLAMANSGDVVLFFKASWCPSCRTLDSDIKANRDMIPSDLTILELDYDMETELKKKYGVTSQHTLVQVAADGTMIKKWSGGSKLENLLAQIQ